MACSIPVRSPLFSSPRIDGCDLLELRLDYLRDGHEEVIRRHAGLPAIITIRDPGEGGVNPVAPAVKERLLKLALDLGLMIDAELSFLHDHPLGPHGVIASRHVFRGRLSWRLAWGDYGLVKSMGYSIYKVASADSRDVPIMARLLMSAGDVRVAAMVMGSKRARAALAMLGSAILYCSVGEPTANGQLTIEECRGLLELIRALGTKNKA
ncbi:MAG: type I 3-dehydroquinate dehydratase [Thermocladium sp.]|jgi:3-dehydroquinate dehydratase-1